MVIGPKFERTVNIKRHQKTRTTEQGQVLHAVQENVILRLSAFEDIKWTTFEGGAKYGSYLLLKLSRFCLTLYKRFQYKAAAHVLKHEQ